MVPIDLVRALHVELAYRVLARLDLGRDPASLYRRSARPSPRDHRLRATYLEDPGRLYLQVLPLWHETIDGMLAQLDDCPFMGPDLCHQMAEGMKLERAQAEAAFRAEEARARDRWAELEPLLVPPLQALREALWQGAGAAPPPLRIYSANALHTDGWSHGRSTLRAGQVRVAIALQPDAPRILCQVLHEEVHLVTDPPALAEVGARGPGVHQRLEQVAVQRGYQLIARHAPALTDSYAAWCARYGYAADGRPLTSE